MSAGSNRPVLVTGAAGFVGRETVRRLLHHGIPVRAMIRGEVPSDLARGSGAGDASLGIVRGDLRDQASLVAAARGVRAVVHLAARKADEADSEDVNVEGARRLVAACRTAGCARIVSVSTQSAKIPRRGTYGRTKAEADRILEGSGLAVTTLFPSVIYGESREGIFGTICTFVEKLPVVPILGDGRWISHPVYVGDVAELLRSCLAHDACAGRQYDVGGPDAIRFDDLVDRIAGELGRRPPRKIHVPLSWSLAAARLAARLLAHPPITVSNVLGSNQDAPFDPAPARVDLGFEPLDLATGLAAALGRIPNPRALGSPA